MVGIAQSNVDVVLESDMVLHHREADATAYRPDRHVARQQEGLGRDVVTVVVDKSGPLLTVDTHQINPLAHAEETRIGEGVRIGSVGEDGELLRYGTA